MREKDLDDKTALTIEFDTAFRRDFFYCSRRVKIMIVQNVVIKSVRTESYRNIVDFALDGNVLSRLFLQLRLRYRSTGILLLHNHVFIEKK